MHFGNKQRVARSLFAAASLTAAGCAGVSYTPTTSLQPHQPKPPAEIEIILSNQPPRPFTLVGYLATHRAGVEDSLRMMREKAAEVGLDGVCEVICAPPGTVNAGTCSGSGFLWKAANP